MAGVRMELGGADKTLAALGAALARTRSPRGLMDGIGREMVARTKLRFQAQTGPDGGPWPQSIRARVMGGRTLIQRGRLLESITHEASDSSVAVGTNTLYAAIHQLGGTIKAKTGKGLRFRLPGGLGSRTVKSVTIPARPFLGLSGEDEGVIKTLIALWLGASEGGADAGR
jgi:phage virion morphogenesis protein